MIVNKNYIKIIWVISILFFINACGERDQNIAKIVGLEKSRPDEFSIAKNIPLTVPPNFSLRPPANGIEETKNSRAINNAKQLFLQSLSDNNNIDTADTEILLLSGADKADPNIRILVDEETIALAKLNDTLVNKILFMRDVESPETVIDAHQERKRILANQGLGENITGDGSIIIKRETEVSGFEKTLDKLSRSNVFE